MTRVGKRGCSCRNCGYDDIHNVEDCGQFAFDAGWASTSVADDETRVNFYPHCISTQTFYPLCFCVCLRLILVFF